MSRLTAFSIDPVSTLAAPGLHRPADLALVLEVPTVSMQHLGEPQLPFILTLNFCNYACTFTVQGLWGGPFLREVHGLTIIESGNVLLAAVLAYQVGIGEFFTRSHVSVII